MAPLVAGRSITHAGLVESGTAGELGVSNSDTNPTNQLFPSRFSLRSSSHQSIASITLLSPQQLPPTNSIVSTALFLAGQPLPIHCFHHTCFLRRYQAATSPHAKPRGVAAWVAPCHVAEHYVIPHYGTGVLCLDGNISKLAGRVQSSHRDRHYYTNITN
jgi:hypothetical protein